MSQPISLFSGYSKAENRITNYCLLILRLLYEENPKYLDEFFSSVTNGLLGNNIGVNFQQQKRKEKGVPDGFITQQPLTISIETKTHGKFFDESQLKRHLEDLSKEAFGKSDERILIALANFESDRDREFPGLVDLLKNLEKKSIYLVPVSFEEFLEAIQTDHLSRNLIDSIEELRQFFDEKNLLPSWKNHLDIVNCAKIPEDIIKHNVYMCPATAGTYSHRRCKYFGMYINKKVKRIAKIEGMVDIELEVGEELKWNNGEKTDNDLIARAKEKLRELRPNAGPTRVFLLGETHETNFVKSTKGGMWGSKHYIDISSLQVENVKALAEGLSGKSWKDLE